MWCKSRKKSLKMMKEHGISDHGNVKSSSQPAQPEKSVSSSHQKPQQSKTSVQQEKPKSNSHSQASSYSSSQSKPSNPPSKQSVDSRLAAMYGEKEKGGAPATEAAKPIEISDSKPASSSQPVQRQDSAMSMSSDISTPTSASINPQNQLAQLVHLLQQGNTVQQVAKNLNMTLDEKTVGLMENLSKQLALAATMSKQEKVSPAAQQSLQTVNPSLNQTEANTSSYNMDLVSDDGSQSNASFPDNFVTPGEEQGSSSVGQDSYTQDSYDSGPYVKAESTANSSSNAGVAAALAQMLAKQGHKVAVGGREISNEENSGYNSEAFYGRKQSYTSQQQYSTDIPVTSSTHTASSTAQRQYGYESGNYQDKYSSQQQYSRSGIGQSSNGNFAGQFGRQSSSQMSTGPRPLMATPVQTPRSILKKKPSSNVGPGTGLANSAPSGSSGNSGGQGSFSGGPRGGNYNNAGRGSWN
jgi:hypothetical protein